VNSRRLFPKIAQMAILILLIAFVFFLIKGLAWSWQPGSHQQSKSWERTGVSESSGSSASSERPGSLKAIEWLSADQIKIRRFFSSPSMYFRDSSDVIYTGARITNPEE
jgi:hypothetical protein